MHLVSDDHITMKTNLQAVPQGSVVLIVLHVLTIFKMFEKHRNFKSRNDLHPSSSPIYQLIRVGTVQAS